MRSPNLELKNYRQWMLIGGSYSKAHSLDPTKEIPDIVEWFEKVMAE